MRTQRPNRLVLMMSDHEMAAVQDYRFAQRVGSKSAAARSLINEALMAKNENGPAATAIAPSQEHDQPR